MPNISLNQDRGLEVIEKHGERILVCSFYGSNRFSEYVEYHQRVFSHFKIPINHVNVDFSRYGHGSAINAFLDHIDNLYDYLILFDTDAVPLSGYFVDIAFQKIRDKRTVYGMAQQSNHIRVNNTFNHVYAGPCAFAISREMYIGLGRPSFLETPRGDCAEEITWRAEELGYSVCTVFPSHVHEVRWQLGNGHKFGIGTTYGNCVFHAFCQMEENSANLFIRKCEEILTRP